MKTKCPHCGKDIDVVSAKELFEEYGIDSNALQYAKSKGRFPAPWLGFANRDVFLRDDIDVYVSNAARERAEGTFENLRASLASLPPKERDAMLDELRERLNEDSAAASKT